MIAARVIDQAGKLEVERLDLDLLEQLDHVMAVVAPTAAHKPIALGVIYEDPRPTFEADVIRQNAAAREGKTADLQGLLKKGQTWTVKEGGPEL